MIVMKFGGTSVGGYEEISNAISIVRQRLEKKPVVVTSAMSKMTDLLYNIAASADKKQDTKLKENMDKLRERHIDVAEHLLESNVEMMLQTTSRINEICDELEAYTKAICVLGELSARSKALIISYGEILSSTIFASAMNASGIKTALVDAREMIITNDNHLKADPDIEKIRQCVPHIISSVDQDTEVVLTQGFIAKSKNGEPTVLGRGGSDYSASLIAMALDAETIEIWTDVDGVLTADPNKIKTAQRLEKISFEEAAEMAHFGAKVLHPLTIEPAIKKNIPIYVLNSKNPQCEGTAILNSKYIADGAKSISFKENILVINIFSTKMINASGFLGKVFDIFSVNRVSVDLISTSEANISVTVEDGQDIHNVIEELSAFATVEVDTGKAQISVVGQNLINQPGVLDKIFAPLDKERIYMVSQGASLINLSIVVDKQALNDSIEAIHNAFFA
ncbi:MAG TPA: lysine-sensitive aspartokinase 3 [Prevotellaceae bacterium]|nr:lysine-sensitive aspartokinase 3 [Prevotellaceae bacterium]